MSSANATINSTEAPRSLILSSGARVRWLPLRTPTLPPATHTNCVLLGTGRYILVDPASPWEDEQARLFAMIDALAAAGEAETLVGLFLTHHHLDHVSGARATADKYNVPIFAHALTAAKLAGRLTIDKLLDEGDVLPLDEEWRLLHTPGHAPGHLCAHHAASGVMAAGDMVAAIGTILIEPSDDGDMIQYLASLRRLRALLPTCLVPAHGEPIVGADAVERLDFYVAHRLMREAKVVTALDATPRTLFELVPLAYADAAPSLHLIASRSLLAHLQKLEREGVAKHDATDDKWWRA